MDHNSLKDRLFLFHDPETSREERQFLQQHLNECEECRLALKQWEQVQVKFSRTTLAPSPSFVFQVMERLQPVEQVEKGTGYFFGLGPKSNLSPFLSWLFPAVGYSFALVLMFVVIAHRELPVNTETILLADMPHASQWALGNEAPDAGDFFEMSGSTSSP